jgi:hypothetical protein
MSIIQFVSSGGVAIVGGDLNKADQAEVKGIITLCGDKLQAYSNSMPALVPHMHVQNCNYLFVGKDTQYYHFVFTNNFGATNVNCRDYTSHGRVKLETIVGELKKEGDEIVWACSFPANITLAQNEPYIQEGIVDYVGNILKVEETASLDRGKTHYNPVVLAAELSEGLEKFKQACPAGACTALIMQCGSTQDHMDIVAAIKSTLDRNNIIGLCAQDKKFMDDPFLNAKTYMHACNFGVAVFDHLSEGEVNPEVSLELGYMLGLGKRVLLLKDKSISHAFTDLTGSQYKHFDTANLVATLPPQIDQWLSDNDLL